MNHGAVGSVVSLWRYPVKSMMGEELNAADIGSGGLLGDRAYALVDRSDGKIASAKNPKKWPGLFSFRAVLTAVPKPGASMPPARITLPDGTLVSSDQSGTNEILSVALQREVALLADVRAAQAEEYWLDIEGLDKRDTVTDFEIPEGTFFDAAAVHLLTTATLDRLRELYPQGRFEARRFRPNIVVETPAAGFVENEWIGKVLSIGDQVRLSITGPCPRCVMTTLAQGDLPHDTGILKTAVKHNGAGVGVYAAVVQGGRVRRGDHVMQVD